MIINLEFKILTTSKRTFILFYFIVFKFYIFIGLKISIKINALRNYMAGFVF